MFKAQQQQNSEFKAFDQIRIQTNNNQKIQKSSTDREELQKLQQIKQKQQSNEDNFDQLLPQTMKNSAILHLTSMGYPPVFVEHVIQSNGINFENQKLSQIMPLLVEQCIAYDQQLNGQKPVSEIQIQQQNQFSNSNQQIQQNNQQQSIQIFQQIRNKITKVLSFLHPLGNQRQLQQNSNLQSENQKTNQQERHSSNEILTNKNSEQKNLQDNQKQSQVQNNILKQGQNIVDVFKKQATKIVAFILPTKYSQDQIEEQKKQAENDKQEINQGEEIDYGLNNKQRLAQQKIQDLPNNINQIELEIKQQQPLCYICYGEIEDDNFQLQCSHRYCRSCVIGYISNQITTKQVEQIQCPEEECEGLISEDEVKVLVSIELQSKYLKFKREIEVEKNPNAKWCSRMGCEDYVIRQSNSNKGICKTCGQNVCMRCGTAYHGNVRCEQLIDDNYQRAIKQFKIKLCPKCRAPIQKSQGCNHMTCYKCHYQFCWLCAAKYTNIHYRLLNPFGCCMLDAQFHQKDPKCNPTLLRILWFFPKLILFFFFLLGLSFLDVLFFLCNALMFINQKPDTYDLKGKCQKICQIFVYFFLGLFILVLTIIIWPFWFICKLVKKTYKLIRKQIC